jgi:DNA-binding MarR family transcriptional regulator
VEFDHVDAILEEWAAEWPGLDVSPQGIVGRLSRLSRFLERDIADTFERFGLTGGEFDVLATLRRTMRRSKVLTPTGLADALMLSSAAMTNRIDRLEEAGLVTRDRDDVDRRAVLVRLSEEGRVLIDRALVAHLKNEAEMISVLTSDDQVVLAGLLRKLLVPIERSRPPVGVKHDKPARPSAGGPPDELA